MKSQGELKAAVCDAVAGFQQEFLGRGPRRVHAHLVENRLFVHLDGVLTAAEQQLIRGEGSDNGRGNELLKQLRNHVVVAGRQLLERLVEEAAGAAPVSVHHDISPTTGEEVIVLTLASTPACRDRRRR